MKKNKTQTKRKKLHLRNLSPLSFADKPAVFNDTLLKKIEKIRYKYHISPSFQLVEHLANLPIEILTFQEGTKQIPTTKEKHHYIDAIREKAEELLNLLYSSGSLISAQIARNTKDSFKTISRLRNEYLPSLITGCKVTKCQIPPTKAGRPRDPLKFAILYHLINIYILGTGKEPTCGYDDIQESHLGECFKFISDLNSSILKHLKLPLGKSSTIGQYLHESLKYRYFQISHGYSVLLSHLVDEPQPDSSHILYKIFSMEQAFLLLKAHPHIT